MTNRVRYTDRTLQTMKYLRRAVNVEVFVELVSLTDDGYIIVDADYFDGGSVGFVLKESLPQEELDDPNLGRLLNGDISDYFQSP